MGEDSIEIDVSIDSCIDVVVFGLCLITDSTSTWGGFVFIDSACFGLFELFTAGIGCLPSS